MDRSDDFISFCHQVATATDYKGQIRRWHPSSSLLLPAAERSTFWQASSKVQSHIASLWRFVDEHGQDRGHWQRRAAAERDRLEAAAHELVKSCELGVQQLRHSLGNARPDRAAGVTAAQIAHSHGVVLVLHTQLSRAVLALERLRDSGSPATALRSRVRAAAATPAPALRSVLQQGATLRATPQAVGAPPSSSASAGRVSFATSIDTSGGGGAASGASTGRGASDGSNDVMAQAQMQANAQHMALAKELADMYDRTRGLERSMHEVADLNRSMATHLMSQTEQIERLYDEAILASEHIAQGNVQLQKTTAVNSSAGWSMFWIIIAASVLLLVVDSLYPG